MPTTTRSFCAIIQLPSLLGSGSKPMQLFGLRKTPDLSLALPQARSPWVGTGSVPATGGWSATAGSHILPNFSDTRSDCLGDANGSRERAPDDRLRIVRCNPGEGDSPRANLWRLPLTPTLSPQAGRGG